MSYPLHKSLLLFIGLFMLSFSGSAVQAHADTPQDQSQPAIWTIEGPESSITIFGSFHALTPELEWCPSTLNSAMDSASAIYFEADLTPDGFRTIAMALVKEGTNPEGGLLDQLNTSEREQLVAIGTRFGLDEKALDHMMPWYAGLALLQLGVTDAGYDPTAGVDLTLASRAKADGVKIRALETAEEHVGLFTQLQDDSQLAFLRAVLAGYVDVDKTLANLRAAWMSQDFGALQQLGNQSFRDVDPELQVRLVNNRNKAWVDKIETMVSAQEDVVVVVGALHTAGPHGIIELLRERGHKVDGPAAE